MSNGLLLSYSSKKSISAGPFEVETASDLFVLGLSNI